MLIFETLNYLPEKLFHFILSTISLSDLTFTFLKCFSNFLGQ
jgi:hypothetical protein